MSAVSVYTLDERRDERCDGANRRVRRLSDRPSFILCRRRFCRRHVAGDAASVTTHVDTHRINRGRLSLLAAFACGSVHLQVPRVRARTVCSFRSLLARSVCRLICASRNKNSTTHGACSRSFRICTTPSLPAAPASCNYRPISSFMLFVAVLRCSFCCFNDSCVAIFPVISFFACSRGADCSV